MTGTIVGERYELLRAIGSGSFGRTFVARDRESGRTVAIKALDARSDLGLKSHEPEREASVLRSLRHQGVPEVFDPMIAPWEGWPTAFLGNGCGDDRLRGEVVEGPLRVPRGRRAASTA